MDYYSTEEKRKAIAEIKASKDWKQGVSYTQDNDLIEACYTMSLAEKRVLMLGISKINPIEPPVPIDPNDDLSDYDPNKKKPLFKSFAFEITTDEWLEHFPTENPWRDMKDACDSLLTRYLTLKEPKSTIKMSWVDYVRYHEGEASLTLRLGNEITTRLSGMLENFTRIKLLETKKLRSVYAIRLYEITQKWSTGLTILSIDELRRVFNVEDKYPRFAELKRRVIEAAVKEVNLNSPKHIEVEYQKRGRKITHVKFFCLNSKS